MTLNDKGICTQKQSDAFWWPAMLWRISTIWDKAYRWSTQLLIIFSVCEYFCRSHKTRQLVTAACAMLDTQFKTKTSRVVCNTVAKVRWQLKCHSFILYFTIFSFSYVQFYELMSLDAVSTKPVSLVDLRSHYEKNLRNTRAQKNKKPERIQRLHNVLSLQIRRKIVDLHNMAKLWRKTKSWHITTRTQQNNSLKKGFSV